MVVRLHALDGKLLWMSTHSKLLSMKLNKNYILYRVFSFAPIEPAYQLLRFIFQPIPMPLPTCWLALPLVSPCFRFFSHKKPFGLIHFIFRSTHRYQTVYIFPTVQKCNVRFKLILITQQKRNIIAYC